MAKHAIAVSEQTDEQLIDLTRDGDMQAYSELWQRHVAVAVRVARRTTNKVDPEDLVSEAFMNVLKAIKNGSGPRDNFRAYLLTSVRNCAATQGSAGDSQPRSQFDEETLSQIIPVDDHQEAISEKMVTVRAFRTLPTRWQEVLWFRDVEDLPVADVAKIVGMSPNSVTQLIRRAREGMKQAWIQAQLAASNTTPECAWLIERVSKYSRGKLTVAEKMRADAHLIDCHKCPIIVEEADHINAGLALSLVPLILGGAAVAGGLHSGTASAGTGVAALLHRATSPRTWTVRDIAAASGVTGAIAASVLAVALLAQPVAETETPRQPSTEGAPPAVESPSTPAPEAATTPAPAVATPTESVQPAPASQVPVVTYSTEVASGGASPGMKLLVTFSDATSAEVIADASGTWSTTVAWDSTKPEFAFTAEPIAT